MTLLLREGGLRAPCTGSGWLHCNRMSRRRSRWTCQFLSVLTPVRVPLHPLGPGGPPPVPLHCVCWEQGGWEVTVFAKPVRQTISLPCCGPSLANSVYC